MGPSGSGPAVRTRPEGPRRGRSGAAGSGASEEHGAGEECAAPAALRFRSHFPVDPQVSSPAIVILSGWFYSYPPIAEFRAACCPELRVAGAKLGQDSAYDDAGGVPPGADILQAEATDRAWASCLRAKTTPGVMSLDRHPWISGSGGKPPGALSPSPPPWKGGETHGRRQPLSGVSSGRLAI